ncbi:MAG: FRG domain-containing protein [Leptospiraceae bacterium]|nr:FRG domain-containing protein [Leptospiraceae bacterium]
MSLDSSNNITNLSELVYISQDYFEQNESILYRGQANSSWNLEASVYLEKVNPTNNSNQENLNPTHIINREAYELFKKKIEIDSEKSLSYFAKKQHHKELITKSPSWDELFLRGSRFIDFTRNFWIAMYFACDQYKREYIKPSHGAIWIIDFAMLLEVQGFPKIYEFDKQEFLEIYSRYQSVSQNNTSTAACGLAVVGQIRAGKTYEIIQDDPILPMRMNPEEIPKRMKLQEGELFIHLGNSKSFEQKLNSLRKKNLEKSKNCLVYKLEFEWSHSLIGEIQDKLDELGINDDSLGFSNVDSEDFTQQFVEYD